SLLEAGAPVNARLSRDAGSEGQDVTYSLRSGQTPLHAAAGAGYPGVVLLLLSRKAEVNAQDGGSRTPLAYAVERRNEPITKSLLAAHADPNAGTADLPLQLAVYNGDAVLAGLLLASGADPNTNSVIS